MRIITILYTLIFSLNIWASQLCENLSNYSCAPGTIEDGTGNVVGLDELDKRHNEIETEVSKQLKTKFENLLNNKNQAYFRRVAISGLGFFDTPICPDISANPLPDTCREKVIEGLIKLGKRELLSSFNTDFDNFLRQGNLANLSSVIAYGPYNQILTDVRDSTEAQILEKYASEEEIRNKIYPQVQELLAKKIESMPIDPEQKKLMAEKVRAIEFKGFDCAEPFGEGFASVPSAMTPNAAFYNGSNGFWFCSSLLLMGNSHFQIAGVIAHELAHSLGPCALASGPTGLAIPHKRASSIEELDNQYPIPPLLRCLRQENSIGSRNKSFSPPKGGFLWGGDQSTHTQDRELAEHEKATACAIDTAEEDTCDWFSAEVLPQYIKKNFPNLDQNQLRNGYSNVLRYGCVVKDPTKVSSSGGMDFGKHSETADRIDRMFLQNPEIRSQMGCPAKHSKYIYCDGVTDISNKESITTEEEDGSRKGVY